MSRTVPEIAGIKAYDHEGLQEICDDLGLKTFRLKQIENWIYGKCASSYDEMTNLSKDLREKLKSSYPLTKAQIENVLESSDGTKKYLIKYSDGTLVESVGIPSKSRLTICVSTQAGCKMGCAFCATAKGGFSRNLAPGEIFDQVALIAEDFHTKPTNVVMMGQGEPLNNFDASIGAARFLNSSNGFGIGARHITISTCGIVPMIRRLASINEQFTLAVSLHSAIQNTRDKLMPGVKGYSLDRLRDSLISYSEINGRRPTLEYAMIENVNDDAQHLDALINFCKKMLCHVNLIPLNRVDGCGYKPSRSSKVETFYSGLMSHGVNSSIRKSRGADIKGACGQLIENYQNHRQ